MRRALLCPLLLVSTVLSAHTCPAGPAPGAPQASPPTLVTSDIDLFWRVVDAQAGKPDLAAALQRDYIGAGSPGLAEFTKLRIGNGKALAQTFDEFPKYFASLRGSSRKIDALKPQMHAAFQCLRNLYPAAKWPDVYFLIGRMNSAGTVDASKLLIGFDMFGKTDEVSIAELDAWHKAVVSPVERLPYIVAHELIHAQQAPLKEKTLLAAALFEGVADFVGELISGQTINPHLHAFARNRHAELWRAFEPAMSGKDISRWLYQGENSTREWPADLGYYMGYRIAEAYYHRKADKTAAIRDMLNIADSHAFLAASGYAERMRNAP